MISHKMTKIELLTLDGELWTAEYNELQYLQIPQVIIFSNRAFVKDTEVNVWKEQTTIRIHQISNLKTRSRLNYDTF